MASDLIREAMAPAESTGPPPEPLHPSDVNGIIARNRAEIDKNIQTIVGIMNAQNERHLNAMRIQRRWNYGLTATLVLGAILAAVAYLRS